MYPQHVEGHASIDTNSGLGLRSYLQTSGSPWLRLGARLFDGFLIGSIITPFVPWKSVSLPPGTERLMSIPILLIWIPIEALFVSRFGTTPGKWLFGISVLNKDGSRLGFNTAIERSGTVFLKGMGLGVATPFTLAWSFWRIASYGEASWDRDYSSVVLWHRKYFRVCLGTLVLLAFFHLAAMAVWVHR
jgi:uncharacterized RDD family membrane protein YckC